MTAYILLKSGYIQPFSMPGVIPVRCECMIGAMMKTIQERESFEVLSDGRFQQDDVDCILFAPGFPQ